MFLRAEWTRNLNFYSLGKWDLHSGVNIWTGLIAEIRNEEEKQNMLACTLQTRAEGTRHAFAGFNLPGRAELRGQWEFNLIKSSRSWRKKLNSFVIIRTSRVQLYAACSQRVHRASITKFLSNRLPVSLKC